jgi:DnaK suppressor protein
MLMTDIGTRNAHLRRILIDRRHDLQQDLQRRLSDRRTDHQHDVHDEVERGDADLSVDLEFALMQMKAETLSRVDSALARLEAGDYGQCFECGAEIAETRLRALPFAVRCKTCEEQREQGQAATRRLAEPPNSVRFSEIIGA